MERERELSQSRRVNTESRKYLPAGYKGPISGYYEQVSRYFDRKSSEQSKGLTQAKQLANPAINNHYPRRQHEEIRPGAATISAERNSSTGPVVGETVE